MASLSAAVSDYTICLAKNAVGGDEYFNIGVEWTKIIWKDAQVRPFNTQKDDDSLLV